MMLIEKTTLPDAAMPVEDFKTHLRLGTGFGTDGLQDSVLAGFLRAAMAAVEARTGKVLLQRDFDWTLTFWRDGDAQVLPVAPVSVVSRVALVARDGSETDIPDQSYRLERDGQRPRLRATGAGLPTIPFGGSVQIEFSAGYAAEWSALPADLRQAVLLLAAHYYEYRNETAFVDGHMPFGVASLIERYRALRIGAGAAR
ncbi:head-tail connector protein [Sulfitobacter sp. D35]|uniref:head-tail connector protein n=1 Tax=Sulfitobacter sp. D35 TaxID=3083252 RepID=UPI00296F7A32|nr:head-tail connector protein [Sulfitobacter sp. D35]MDW4496817.1 head-tail connector protein [Sulfitobacter sp. D35]